MRMVCSIFRSEIKAILDLCSEKSYVFTGIQCQYMTVDHILKSIKHFMNFKTTNLYKQRRKSTENIKNYYTIEIRANQAR